MRTLHFHFFSVGYALSISFWPCFGNIVDISAYRQKFLLTLGEKFNSTLYTLDVRFAVIFVQTVISVNYAEKTNFGKQIKRLTNWVKWYRFTLIIAQNVVHSLLTSDSYLLLKLRNRCNLILSDVHFDLIFVFSFLSAVLLARWVVKILQQRIWC